MRLRFAWCLIALVGLAGLVWGWTVNREAVPARPSDQTIAVPQSWYQSLPLDSNAATAAYLSRLPSSMSERGERYSDTRMLTFQLRVLTLLAATGFLCATRFAPRAREVVGGVVSKPWLVDTAVALQYFVALYALSLPTEIYATFIRQHRFGFSEQPFAGWVADSLVNWAVFTAFYVVGLLAIYRFIRRRPKQWVAWAAGIYLILSATYSLLSPSFIEPLTNTFRPLPEGKQKQQIVALAHASGIQDVAVVVGDASQQTRLLNAHVSGIGGTARISVDDTTLRSTSDPMLRAVVAHEIGHYVMNHVAQSVVTDTVTMSVGCGLIALVTGMVVRRLGSRLQITGAGDIGGLPVFWGLYLLWGFASLPMSNAISRHYEHQADLYALNASQAPHGLAEFMIHDADVVRLRPTAIEYALFYSHPSDAERVATAMQWRAAQANLADR